MTDTITITGNVATDPDHKRTNGGVAITTFRVASGQRRFDRSTGTWVDAGTNWYSVSTFRSLAEHAHLSLRRGDRVILTGRLRVRDWDNGTKKGTAIEIDADAIGHDLLWGTTAFTKDVREPEPPREAPAPAGGEDRWAAPGASPDDSSWAAPEDQDAPKSLIEVATPY